MEGETTLLLNETREKPTSKGQSSAIAVYFTFVTGFIGGGLLGLPYGFKEGGLFASIIGLVLLSLISNFTLRLLAWIKEAENISTYSDIGKLCFGKVGVILVNASVLVSQIGYCCAYVVYISTNLTSLTWFPNVEPWKVLLVIGTVLILLVWLRNLKYLSPASIISNIAVVGVVAVVLAYGFMHAGIGPLSEYKPYFRVDFPIFYGIVAFSFTIHGLVFDIQDSLRKPEQYYMVMDSAMGFVTVIYILFGTLGYLFFRDATNSVITINLGQDIEADVVKLCLSAVLVCAYPLQMFPVVKILEGIIFKPKEQVPSAGLPNILDSIKRNVFRVVVVILTIVAALFVPYFGLFASLVGCFSNSFLAFIFPTVFYLKIFHFGNRGKSVKPALFILCVIVGLVGLAGLLIGSTITLRDLVQEFQKNHH